MFGRKKDVAKISDRTPVFHVRYIGCTETYVATGTGCSYVPVQRLWDNSPVMRDMKKVAIHISPKGLSLRDLSEKQTTPSAPPQQQQPQFYYHPQHDNQQQQHHQHQRLISQDFAIENISFCNVDRAVNERIFSWIYRHDTNDINRRSRRLDCHAVLCSTAQKAQTMAIVLSRAFQIAYKDWRAQHRHSDFPPIKFSSMVVSNALSSSRPEDEKRNNIPIASSSSSVTTVASKPATSSATSSPAERKDDRESPMTAPSGNETSAPCLRASESASSSSPSPPLEAGAYFADDLTGDDVVDAAPNKVVRSSVSVQQAATSSYLVSSGYIMWDPDLKEVDAGGVDSLQADVDLEDSESD